MGCLQQLFNKGNEVNKKRKNELEFQTVLYQFKGSEGMRRKETGELSGVILILTHSKGNS